MTSLHVCDIPFVRSQCLHPAHSPGERSPRTEGQVVRTTGVLPTRLPMQPLLVWEGDPTVMGQNMLGLRPAVEWEGALPPRVSLLRTLLLCSHDFVPPQSLRSCDSRETNSVVCSVELTDFTRTFPAAADIHLMLNTLPEALL